MLKLIRTLVCSGMQDAQQAFAGLYAQTMWAQHGHAALWDAEGAVYAPNVPGN
ncbi:hypothetical protein [Thalassospira sp. TSL5-1]|uniref:hypothetical protein n=1 Tax=Thalassospira sp. TSL5-1 TaxID=1544451 RepID=UPI000AE20834|nr:hypothetical protein [Thalassospira sp. TSL5-1]